MPIRKLGNLARNKLFGKSLRVWYDTAYRLPLSSLEGQIGIETRRADFAIWYLLDCKAITKNQICVPRRVSYGELAKVHTPSYLESLSDPETLARIFAASKEEIFVEELLQTVRLACGATIEATRASLRTKSSMLNLLGGFHHAAPSYGGGFCAVNDIAVSIATLREEGFLGQVSILDLDAHPPDGLALCLQNDPAVWIGSLSPEKWEKLSSVEEVIVPVGCQDELYCEKLQTLLEKMPKSALTFVIAGGDVLANDRMGRLGLSLSGARKRDRLLDSRLRGTAAVWLPGGGYHRNSWKVLAGTALVLGVRSSRAIPENYDPLRSYFSSIADGLNVDTLIGGFTLDNDDIDEVFGYKQTSDNRLLDFYTKEGIEYAFFRFGIWDYIRRLGYRDLTITLDTVDQGSRIQLFGKHNTKTYQLIECVLERSQIAGVEVLYIHWLRLQNPRSRFHPDRPKLPGQEVPGLGIAREISEVLFLVAKRLKLPGVAMRPAWYHVAYAIRHHFRFLDPKRQGRFLALLRDMKQIPLQKATLAIAEKCVQKNGNPYTWEADEMVFLQKQIPKEELREIRKEKENTHFSLKTDPDSLDKINN